MGTKLALRTADSVGKWYQGPDDEAKAKTVAVPVAVDQTFC